MGLTYAELCVFGKLRKIERLGPVSMFDRMVNKETYEDVKELSVKIKRFFTHYGNNRHKVTTLPPSFSTILKVATITATTCDLGSMPLTGAISSKSSMIGSKRS